MSWPVIWVLTLTVLSAVTVPSARTTTGMSPLAAAAIPTGVAAPAAKRPCRAACVVVAVPVCEIYRPAPATTASPKPIPSRVRSLFIVRSAPKRSPFTSHTGRSGGVSPSGRTGARHHLLPVCLTRARGKRSPKNSAVQQFGNRSGLSFGGVGERDPDGGGQRSASTRDLPFGGALGRAIGGPGGPARPAPPRPGPGPRPSSPPG